MYTGCIRGVYRVKYDAVSHIAVRRTGNRCSCARNGSRESPLQRRPPPPPSPSAPRGLGSAPLAACRAPMSYGASGWDREKGKGVYRYVGCRDRERVDGWRERV